MSQVQMNQQQVPLVIQQPNNGGPAVNNLQQPAHPPVQQPAPQDVNAAALSRLSDTDRAAAEVFLKGVSTQEALKHTKFSLATKIISGLFTFGIAPAIMCHVESKKERQLAQDVVRLKDSLNALSQDKNLRSKDNTVVSMDGKNMFIKREADGVLTATIGGEKIVSNYNAKTLAEKLEDDIVTNTDLYGTQAALDIFAKGKEAPEPAAGATGHAGQSLTEQYDAAKAKIDQRLAKAEAAVKKDGTASALMQELEAAQRDCTKLQEQYEKTEISCNKILRKCEGDLNAIDKGLKLLQASKSQGAKVDGLLEDANTKKKIALETKAKAEADLVHLRTKTRSELETANIRRDAALLAAGENALCKGLMDARQALESLTSTHTQKLKSLNTRLHQLETLPLQDKTAAVQAEISALKTTLDGAQAPLENPWELQANDPKDALDSKGVTDTRQRELCLKAIKAHMGIDGGELHSCPTRYLNRMAQYAIEGYYGSAQNLLDHVLKISTTNRIASQDVMELMNVRQQDANSGQKVNVAVLKPKQDGFRTATQQQVANFAADIIYSGNLVDEDKLAPEVRLRKVLQTNAVVIGDMIKVEAGVNAVDLETKATEAEAKAALPNATEADKLEAKAARAEADAAQFAAKALRGSMLGKAANAIDNFFSGLFGVAPKKADEKKFTSLESLAATAEAKALRAELEALPQRQSLADAVARAQTEVAEYPDDPARLSALVDAQKALENFDNEHNEHLGSVRNDATAARLAVRLARAEEQASLSGSEADKQKAENLRQAIENAKPGVPDASLGKEFDVSANTALQDLGGRLTNLEQLPEAERTSLLNAVPDEMGDALREMLGDVRQGLLEKNAPADTSTILAGIYQLEDKDLRETVHKVNENVTKAAAAVQEEMTTAILMMDATLTAPTKAVVRELKAALEAEHLPLTRENAEALLERKPVPQAVATALNGLSSAITGVDDAAQRTRLAGKVVANAFEEYARLAQNAREAQDAATQAAQAAKAASDHDNACRTNLNASMHAVNEADNAWKAAQTQAAQSETTAHNAEVTAQALENAFAAQPQNVLEALRLESTATEAESRVGPLEEAAAQAESHAATLEDAAAQAKDAADEAELLTLVAGAPADAEARARTARTTADEAAAAAANARNAATTARNAANAARDEATTARNAANAVVQAVGPQALADARTAQERATTARQQANAARATADQHKAEEAIAKQAFDQASAAHAVNVQARTDSETAKAQAEAAKEKADVVAQNAQAEANAALGVGEDGQPVAVAEENAPAAAPANAAEAHQLRLQQLNATELNKLAEAAGTDFNSDGMGKFIKFVIQDYFQSVPLADKRAMVAAGLRYAPANATPMQKLGAMLKGAGPVLQKIFQGLDGPGLPQDLRIACQDMKSRLAPIPPDIVEAHLLDMVNSSNGRIRNIEVLSSLGAASVGEAFRCRLTDQQGQTRECVIKILRPDAANRVKREQPIFENVAAKVPGMLGTFRGQLEGIMEELDFGIEAGNAKIGAVYDKPFDGQERSIQSVKVVEDIPPKSGSMAMEMAPGTTLDGFLRDTRAEIERMGQNLGRSESFNAQGQRSRVEYNVPEARLNELNPVKARLQELYDQTAARHKQLTALADVWVTEGIFGEQGFFHGDLHAGNIMSDGQKLTVIDFGNATKLTQEQQSAIMTMIVATTTRQSSKFLDSFRVMLSPAAQTVFDSKKQQILESVRIIMEKGDLDDTGNRIAAILGELQRNGVEIPHAIFNFSNSQIRLHNSINEMITLMKHIEEEMRAIDLLRNLNSPQILPFDRNITDEIKQAMADDSYPHQGVLDRIAHYRAQIQDPTSALSVEQNGDVHTALGLATQLVDFKATTVDRDPALLEVWNQHKDVLENVSLPAEQREPAIQAILTALKDKALRELDALEAEELKDHSRGNNPATFVNVMSDVVETNKSAAIKKLGIVSSIKYVLFDKI